MITWNLEALRERRDEIGRIAARWGARNIRVFGSVARSDATQASDVDLLVSFDPERSLLDHGGLLADLEDALGCRVDVVDEDGMRPRFRENVLRDAVPL
jgi:predicted nucleotidyltransferase